MHTSKPGIPAACRRHETPPRESRGSARGGLLLLLMGLAVSGATLWYALRETDLDQFSASTSRIRWGWALPLLGAYALHFWLKALRWRLLLAPVRNTRARVLFSPMLLGFFANNILPARLGELVRAALGARRLDLKVVQIIASLLLERLFDVLSILLFVALVLTFGAHVDERLVRVGQVSGLLVIAALLLSWVVAHWSERILGLFMRLFEPLPENLRERLLLELSSGLDALQSLKRRSLMVGVTLSSLGQWLLMTFALWCSLRAFALALPPEAAFVLLGATVLATMLPAAPGFFGAIQLAYVLALKPFGVDASLAVAASLFFHLLTYFAVIAAGLYFLRQEGMGLRGLGRLSDRT